MDKPHKGTLGQWKKVQVVPPNEEHLGYYITGVFLGHPQFNLRHGYTSMIVKHDEATGEVETLNSRYTLGEQHVG